MDPPPSGSCRTYGATSHENKNEPQMDADLRR